MHALCRLMLAMLLVLSHRPVSADEGRYQLEKIPEGIARLDTRTGEMAICSERKGQLVCRVAADERTALLEEIERLDRRLGELEQRVLALESERPLPGEELPGDEEIERTFGIMERFIRRFFDMTRDLERELNPPPQDQPDRT